MTLTELAALAAEKVPDFKRLVRVERWVAGERCIVWNDSPAALLMAVVAAICKTEHRLIIGFDDETVRVWEVEPVKMWDAYHDNTPEGIARAALVALLRAHGVEVADG